MDDKKLDEILSNMDVPQHDENAQKRALNLALAEFERGNKEKTNFFPRISNIGSSNG